MFDQHEEHIRGLVKAAHAPVLGLLGDLIPTEVKAAIERDVHVMPSARSFAQRLDQYPALFAVWLAEHVMHGLGAAGRFDVYRHVQNAIGGVAALSPIDRDLLWRAFRRALLQLGIQPLARTDGPHFMVNEYLRQAGVPIAFADDLAVRMLALAQSLGVPDEDDQEGLLTWQSSLLNTLQPPFSVTARNAIERDSQAYYTRAFLRVHASQGQATKGDALEAALASAFVRAGGTAHIKHAAIPQLMYRDGVLGVLFPPAASPLIYTLQSGATHLSIRLGEQGAFRQLPEMLPADVQVLDPANVKVLNVKLWPDRASNRLLIFNETGRLRASAHLGQEDHIELPPGRYIALCRFRPSSDEDYEEVNDEPRLVEVRLNVAPGAEHALINGPARVVFVGQNLPSFYLSGKAKEGLDRVEFYFGDLTARVQVPPEWRQIGLQAYEVRVSCGGVAHRLPFDLTQDGTVEVALREALSGDGFGAGLHRVVVELARIGDARTFHRQSALYWVGLTSISFGLRFAYDTRPQNIKLSACSGLKFGDQCTELVSEVIRVLRIGFDVGGGRLISLSWHRPGIFVEVEVATADGSTTRVSRPLGATETVSLFHQKNFIISASEPGFVCLGAWRQFVDFGYRPSKTISASFLSSRVGPGARTLCYETQGGGASVPLLHLSQPHVVTNVSTSRVASVLEIQLMIRGEPTAIAVTGKDLGTGREYRAEHELLAGVWHTSELGRMQVYCVPNSSAHMVYVQVDVQRMSSGIWTIEFEAQVGEAWGRLEDQNEGCVGIAIGVDQGGQEISGLDIVAAAAELDVPVVLRQLEHLNDHFTKYWSPGCWDEQSWLSSYWTALLNRLREHEGDAVSQVADMAMTRCPDDVRQGFFPKQSAGAELPMIFALERAKYRSVNTKPHPLSIALRAMPELKRAVFPAFGPTIHQAAVFAFGNVPEILREMRPRSFSLLAYLQVLRATQLEAPHRLDNEQYLPGPGELLGPIHLAHAWRDLERCYATSSLMPSSRKSLALSLSRALFLRFTTFGIEAPPGLRGQPLVLQLKPFQVDGLDPAEAQRHEIMVGIANACAWFAWHVRLEVRRPGELTRFQKLLNNLRDRIEIPGSGITDCLAYYLHVAPAMFAFYLLLWEMALTVELDPVVQHA